MNQNKFYLKLQFSEFVTKNYLIFEPSEVEYSDC